MRRVCRYPSALHFFGLTQTYRVNFYNQVHEIVFHGKGGYDWDTVFNMPIWLRKFTFQKIQEYYEEEAKASKSKGTNSQSMPTGPNIKAPSYSTKASK